MKLCTYNLQKGKKYLFSNTISFLHQHKDQQVAAAPSNASNFSSLLSPLNQQPNIFGTLRVAVRDQKLPESLPPPIPYERGHIQKTSVESSHLMAKATLLFTALLILLR